MKSSKLRYWSQPFLFAMAIWALFGTTAQAGEPESFANPAPTDSWTGLSFGVGGGWGSLSSNVNAKASRTDQVGCAASTTGCPPDTVLREIHQAYSSSFDDLGGTGGFVTVQGAYDYQFAPRFVAGAFIDADWSDIAADANQTNNSSVSFFCNDPGNCRDDPAGQFSTSNSIISTKVRTEWNVSVGGRLGWLANQGTLLYVLAAYTHADLKDSEVRASIPDPNDLIGVLLGGAPGTSPFPNSPTNLLVKLPDSVDGWSLGGGGEAKIGGPWSVKLEYRWTHLEGGDSHAASNTSQCCFVDSHSESPLFRDASSKASADLELDEQTVRGELVYHFWSGGAGYGG